MAVLFVSHSSKDDALAGSLEAWLHAHGFTDLFVDHGIAGGEKWRDALKQSAAACRVIVCLVSENWLASQDCFGEFVAAGYMGKRIIPLFLLSTSAILDNDTQGRLARVRSEDQGIDLAPCIDANGVLQLEAHPDVTELLSKGLRAAGALARIGLDPEAFAIDRTLRPMPFPGLASFGDDDADAALFYGRSREIAEALEELRKVRAERDLRPFVILGASGAGKSSLLKAGIIPRLRREAPAWLPLRAFRPGADPLLNFAEALARSLADFGKVEAHGVIRDRLFDAWSKAERKDNDLTTAGRAALERALESEGSNLRSAANHRTASILISVDQAEEMARAEGNSGEALADYLRAALETTTSSWQIAFTIRTDSFPELQSHRRFQDLKARGYDLRAVPVFRFDSVVEEPAKRYGVTVDHALVDALMEDSPKSDALPLLAFGLQRLWRQYSASGSLAKDNYEKVGGLRGLIEDAAERALRGLLPEQDVPLPSGLPPKHLVELAASAFVPALVEINDQGATIRRIAEWRSFTDEQRELLIRFDQWRLVVRKGKNDGGTVEVTHEALFREWARLEGWLEPERARLEALRSLQVDAVTWDRNGRDLAFVNHRDTRLSEASALVQNDAYRERLSMLEIDYLAACRKAEAEAKRGKRLLLAGIYVLLVGVIVSLVGIIEKEAIKEQINWFTVIRPYRVANFDPYVLKPDAERALKPLTSFRECAKDCPEMIVIPAGGFTMGSPTTEHGHDNDEGPQHKVTIAKPFAVSKYDVTFADWDACVSVGGCRKITNANLGQDTTKPVVNVDWVDAHTYVAWLSKMTGQPYRLLTEVEWEYAARAGTTTAYYWGDDIGKGNANCNGCGSQWGAKQTSPVGSFAANQFGLYDMAGNVWQWVQDCYHGNYDGAPTDGSAWTSGDCSKPVVRGGSWDYFPQHLRSAIRNRYPSGLRYGNLGFRVGRTLTP
jgi:formylglycine-generating enzyme required for sulfatase activity